jgi:hypothetical protein
MLMDWNKLTLAKNNLTQLYIQMDLNWKNVNVHDWISFCKCSFQVQNFTFTWTWTNRGIIQDWILLCNCRFQVVTPFHNVEQQGTPLKLLPLKFSTFNANIVLKLLKSIFVQHIFLHGFNINNPMNFSRSTFFSQRSNYGGDNKHWTYQVQ